MSKEMSCVVGLMADGRIYIIGDSQITDGAGEKLLIRDNRVFRIYSDGNTPFIIVMEGVWTTSGHTLPATLSMQCGAYLKSMDRNSV